MISISGKPVFDEAGNFCGYCGTGSDIKEQFRVVAEMKWAEMMLLSLLETSMIGFVSYGSNGIYRERVNAGFCEMVGHSEDHLLKDK